MLACEHRGMTLTSPESTRSERVATRRTVLMCRPDFYTVSYRINPWMHPEDPTDTNVALAQWQTLYDLYVQLGYEVELIDPVPGLPDMVYAANGGFTLDGIAYGAKFQFPERGPEGPAYMRWFADHGFEVREPAVTNEGEGDFLMVGDAILAGTGFRSDAGSHDELRRLFGGAGRKAGAVDREVVTLRLIDPSFYHLDTALAVLDPDPEHPAIAYLPSAFDRPSLDLLEERYPDSVLVDDADAAVLGLNSFSDGLNVVIASRAVGFEASLRARGYIPHGLDLSELLLGGGGVKCCTLELRR
jgi:N-dimethylarginine dimethylaminohydrolase